MAELTFDVQRNEAFIDEGGVWVVDPATQHLSVVHGFGCEGEGGGEYSSVAVLNSVRGENGVGQVVRVHPVDFWTHVWTIVRDITGQVQALVTNNFLWNIDVGLI